MVEPGEVRLQEPQGLEVTVAHEAVAVGLLGGPGVLEEDVPRGLLGSSKSLNSGFIALVPSEVSEWWRLT